MNAWIGALRVLAVVSAVRGADPTCDEPPPVEFATLQGGESSNGYPVGAAVTYGCELGYVASGSQRTTECRATDGGEPGWTGLDLSCKPRSCGDPGYVPRGDVVGSLFTFPNAVSFECDEGYRLQGNARRYCQASGSWSGTLPRCKRIYCAPPPSPENGEVKYDSLEFGSEAKYTCPRGYHIEGGDVTYCTSNGTWSRTEVICVDVSCPVPEKPLHGSVELLGSEDRPRAGSLAVFSCEGDRIAGGPTTSKCLDLGQWTFPVPECLEPCSVPSVQNGKIGRYVRGRGYTSVFREIPVGTRLEDEEKLFLHCERGYSPLGSTTNWQERVVCKRGRWTVQPFCEPKSCQSEPPTTQNGWVKDVQRSHGGTVLYECLPDFMRTKTGEVICLFGEWKGVTPFCRDTRCSSDELVFPGLEKGSKKLYRHGEKMDIQCNSRYTLARGPESHMECDNGFWRGPMPPCVAASCSEPPPSVDHGRALIISSSHSSTAQYVCEENHFLVRSGDVQCLFGEWTGRPPACKDSRCFLEDIRSRKGVSVDTESATLSGDRLHVRCVEGYEPQQQQPMCHNGAWSRSNESPCKEKDCTVPWITNGDLTRHTLGPRSWNYWEFRYVRASIFTKLLPGSVPPRSDSVYLVCSSGFSVQGRGPDRALLTCSEGRWSLDPVCLRTGTPYIKTTRKPTTTTQKITSTITQRTTTTTTTTAEPVAASIHDRLQEEGFTSPADVPTIDDATGDCLCEHALDDEKVVAFTEGRELRTGDSVRNGTVVSFRCREVGLQRLEGPRQLTCEGCRTWQRSEFPACVNPEQGDTVIVFSDGVNTTVEGALEVERGQSLSLTCIAVEEAAYPKWSVPIEVGVEAIPERMEREDDYLYMSHLDIANFSLAHEGLYDCAIENYPATTVQLKATDSGVQCPRPVIDEDSLSAEVEGTLVGAEVTFTCKNRDQKLNGTATVTCLRTGRWSEDPPRCEATECEELEGSDLLEVSYASGDRGVGSMVTFHCFPPGKLSGVSSTRCLDSGQWEHPTPSCTAPPCSVSSLFSKLPRQVEPQMGEVQVLGLPYGEAVQLTCQGESVLLGNPVAKCGRGGQWTVDDNIRCVDRTSGCPRLTKDDANLVLQPDREQYSFGDIVTFRCAPGYSLEAGNSRTMCMNGRWTEDSLPRCVDARSDES